MVHNVPKDGRISDLFPRIKVEFTAEAAVRHEKYGHRVQSVAKHLSCHIDSTTGVKVASYDWSKGGAFTLCGETKGDGDVIHYTKLRHINGGEAHLRES